MRRVRQLDVKSFDPRCHGREVERLTPLQRSLSQFAVEAWVVQRTEHVVGEHLRAVVLRIDRARRSFQCTHTRVAIHRDEQRVAERARGSQITDVTDMEQIEDAIRALPDKEREKLVYDLPSLLPELNAEAAWSRIIHDPRPRPALTALGDAIEAQLKANPESLPEIQDSDFDRHS